MNLYEVEEGLYELKKNNIKSICVFCGSRDGSKQKYKNAAKELANLISEADKRLVYGGGNRGLMGYLASAAQIKKCDILGVIPEHLMYQEVGNTNLKNLTVTKNMHQRKTIMYNEADAFIVLPGGVGTLDEFFEILTWSQLALHRKQIIILNIDNFWDPLLNLIKHQVNHKFMDKSINELFFIAKTPKEAIGYLLNPSRQLSAE